MRALWLLAFTALGALPPGAAAAQAAPTPQPAAAPATLNAFLNITPKRLTFDRARRNGTVFLLNQGAEPVTVDISLVDRVMLPDGQIFAAEDAAKRTDGQAAATGLKSARDLVQVSPRRVVLQPGRPQTVRVRLTTLPDAAAGEHRTHLTATTLPPRESGATAEAAAADPSGNQLRFQITAVYGLSIPLIVRPADTDVRAAIDGARVEYAEVSPDGRAPPRRTPVLALDLVRLGGSSVYGNLEVRPAGAGRGGESLGLARGVGVYPEIGRRAVRIPLSRAPAAGEKLEVTFTDDDTSPGKVLAKAAF
jgi:P pilus assembly chaperone PapD